MNICILGGNGFIGAHLARKLLTEGNFVRVVDIKPNEYFKPEEFCSENIIGDLRDPVLVKKVLDHKQGFDEVYQLAADMGGAGFVFTGENDADIMHNSALININVAKECVRQGIKRLFYSSSACMYPAYNQEDPTNPNCEESSAYPAAPDSEYGWEKLFSERLFKAFEKNYGLTVRIARYHNIFGTHGTWKGGREKAPAAICRKIAESNNTIEIWGDGKQTRSFLWIDECVEGTIKLMRSDCTKILNIGSDEMISINDLARMVIEISNKNLTINNISGPIGVMGRNSDNTLIKQELNWAPSQPLQVGMQKLYAWIETQI